LHPLDLVDALPWRRVAFTTYSLSLAFFEGVILDRLIRGGARHASILSDPEGIRAALQEQGARGAGRDYELEPVACIRGVFHPKLSVFAAQEDCHLVLGSGNLTFGGWGGNFEQFEHLHPSFAADAFDDAADFFEFLAISDEVRIGSADKLQPIADELRRAAVGRNRDGGVRILSSLVGPLIDQIVDLASELGGAQGLAVVSPYFDAKGKGVELLASKLGCESVKVHVHADGSVRGSVGTNWPSSAKVEAVIVAEPFGSDGRPLHSKCYEVLCRRGRLLVSGSANATRAALEIGNVEAVVVRIQREATLGWSMTPAKAPAVFETLKDTAEEDKPVGVLTASLEGNKLVGTVLTPRMNGTATLRIDSAAASLAVGTVVVDQSGRFEAQAEALESLGWMGGRMVAVIEQEGRVAKGFVAFGTALEIVKRTGAVAPRIFALLSGTETPEDAAAVLSWLHERPELLPSPAHATYEPGDGPDNPPVMITSEMFHSDADGRADAHTGEAPGTNRAWERAIELVVSAFGPNRPAWPDDLDAEDLPENDDDVPSPADDEERRLVSARRQRAKEKVRGSFARLLDQMLQKSNGGRYSEVAFSLALYVTARLRPPTQTARTWIWRALGDYPEPSLSGDRLALTVALLLIASEGKDTSVIKARRYLLSHRIDPQTVEIEPAGIGELIAFFLPEWAPEKFLAQVRATRTAQEEVRDFLAAAAMGDIDGDYPILLGSGHWRRLDEARRNPRRMDRIKVVTSETACPKCHIAFSAKALDELASTGVTECCRLVVRTVSR
jgi:hypothetical protein